MRHHCKTPWPEAAMPTSADLLTVLDGNTSPWCDDCRNELIEQLIAYANQAHACLLGNHRRLNDDLRLVSLRMNRYHAAWLSARRRGWWLIRRRMEDA